MTIQNKLRLLGISCLAVCFFMVMFSRNVIRPGVSPVLLIVYWGAFLVLFLTALWIAFLDIRFTRAEFKAHERELFRQTFLNDEFRRSLHEAMERANKERSANQED